jgi:photosystem II stability/assembly factor-like uncharacterized protein
MITQARNAYRRLAALGIRAALIGSVALAGCAGAESDITLPDIHGLAYNGDGTKLYVAVHDGLVVFSDGRWSRGPGPRHDYMGFTGTRKHFFSSGHPARGSGMVNPLGLMQSADGGKTWSKRGMEGQSDFHLVAAGFDNDAIYVYNHAPNSRMKAAGIHYTLNQGFTWQHAAGAGLIGKLSGLAVHPTDAATVAASSDAGVFLSRDRGARFEPLVAGRQGLGLKFDLDGKSLWFGSFDTGPTLQRISLDGPRRESAALPQLGRDAVAYIAQNPARRDEIAIATFERNVFVSRDRGKTWKEIAARGKAK